MKQKFRCGLEIHQQLNTKEKLFCSCLNSVENIQPYSKLERFLRPVTSELGEKDPTALFEFLKKNKFIYNLYHNSTCLVELDAEPPHRLNEEALRIVLEAALLMNCHIPDEIQFMRKMVLDGSNTAGFQRTSIVGMDGYIETSEGKVRIKDIELEEEAAALNQRQNKSVIYDLDRLGIPLIEVGTETDIKSIEHAKEVALKIGMLLRSTGKVKRGLGTIRQDVNISIDGGSRVEIKGFQDVKNIDSLIKLEITRQRSLIQIKKELNKRGVKTFKLEQMDSSNLFLKSENKLIRSILKENGVVLSVKLPKFAGLMKKIISDEKTLAKELVDYVKIYGLKGIIHSDENLKKYEIETDFERLANKLKKEKEDVVLIVAGHKDQVKKAMMALCKRIEFLPIGVPEETRAADLNYTTHYSRPLPGKSRMYPETDIPPKEISKALLSKIKKELPQTLEEKEKKYSKLIGKEMASQLVDSYHFVIFEKIISESKFDKKIIANIFTNVLNSLDKRGFLTAKLTKKHFLDIIKLLESRKIATNSTSLILSKLCLKPELSVSDVIKQNNLAKLTDKELKELIKVTIFQNKKDLAGKEYHAEKILMQILMRKIGGRAEGSKISEFLKKELKNN